MPVEARSLKELFLAALAVAPAERAAWLARACAQDAERRQHVERMLAAHETRQSLLDRLAPAAEPPETATGGTAAGTVCPSRTELEEPGAVIAGRYELLEVIGEGGMGTVWMAQQTEPIQRRVAVKLIRAGMESRAVLARFEAERQALALMDHPHIAKVHDGGAGPDGRPYFVMELVQGIPITAFCDLRRLSVRQRLELFVPVCQAVQHAHTKGIIHRDLKPRNVLVALYDGVPVPKVIDFGIAKAAGQTLTAQSLHTGFGTVVGTPEYMSPEQAGFNQLDVDARSDIYSLGVLLYELMAGSPPISRKERVLVDLLEMLRMIREQEPARPSTRLSTAEGLPTLAANRGTEPTKLTKLVRGELDWIVMKALEKDRNRRYETANELAMDVQRYLADEPVLACPPSAGYRLRKFVRRNRGAFLSASSVVLVLMLAVVGLVISNVLITRETNRVLQEQQTGQRRLFEAKLAEAKGTRRSRQPGQRFASWQAVVEAAEIARELRLGEADTLRLRNEAIACLALADVLLIREWSGFPPGSMDTLTLDAALEHYTRGDIKGNISVRRVADNVELAQLPGPGEYARGGGFDASGDLLLVLGHGDPPHTPRVWDWQHRTIVFQSPFPISRSAVGFSPDGRWLALGQEDGTVVLYDVATWKEARKLPLVARPTHLAFDREGARLAVCSHGQVQVCDLATGNVTYQVSHPNVLWLAWHADGDLLAGGCYDGRALVWNVSSGRQRAALQGHQGLPVVRVAFAPGGDLLLCSGWDGFGRIWDPAAGQELVSFGGGFHWSRDGSRVAGRRGTQVGLWECNAGREYRTLPGPARGDRLVHSGLVHPHGRWLVLAASDGIEIWDLAARKQVSLLPLGRRYAVFHPSGRELLTSGADGLHEWPFQVSAGALRIGPPRRLAAGPGHRLARDREGRILAAAGQPCRIVELDKPLEKARHFDHANAAFVAVSPDGRWVATGTWNGFNVKVWEAHTGKLEHTLLEGVPVAAVAFSPDGRWLLTNTEAEVCYWEIGSWRAMRRIGGSGHIFREDAMTFSADGKLLALSSTPGAVQLREPASGRMVAELQAPDANLVGSLSFTPDGGQLVVTSRNDQGIGLVRIWDLRLIRAQLQEIGLDWDLSPYPPLRDVAPARPIQVEVDLGELGRTQK